MAKKEKPGHLDTLLGAHTVLEGNIESGGGVRVDGTLKGDLKAAGDVSVGSDAQVNGNIFGNNVVLGGQVEGNINANGMLRLLSKAKLYGNVQAHGLVADEGAVFHGKCNIVEERSSRRESAGKPSSPDGEAEKGYKSRAALRRAKEEEPAT